MKSSDREQGLIARIGNWDAHHRFVVALIGAIAFFVLSPSSRLFMSRFIGAWVTFAYIGLGLAWNTMSRAKVGQIRKTAAKQDLGKTILFFISLLGACFGVLAIIYLFRTSKGSSGGKLLEHALLSFLSIVASWTLIHTVFAMRYAHLYYTSDEKMEKDLGGLEFPDDENPDYLDFAYFSFVVGMTCQVSDVQVTSRDLRRLVLLHGMLSFGFNTIILALSINLLSSII